MGDERGGGGLGGEGERAAPALAGEGAPTGVIAHVISRESSLLSPFEAAGWTEINDAGYRVKQTSGLLITGVASLVSAVNLIVTVLNMRAPGMTLMKMPIMTWMLLVVQFL